mgnify:CR=1 FL=1
MKKTAKRIRVIGCDVRTKWYFNLAGCDCEFDVDYEQPDEYCVIVGGVHDNFYVDKLDCEVVEWAEPTYRPFADAVEFSLMKDKWITFPNQHTYARAVAFNGGGAWFVNGGWISYKRMLKEALFMDTGNPCGVEVCNG